MAKKDRTEKVIAVLDGIKASKDEKAVSSLIWLLESFRLFRNDELLALVLLNPSPPETWFCCFGDQSNSPCVGEDHRKFLQEQIAQRRDAFLNHLRPFHVRCKNQGVKFEVKVFAGSLMKEVLVEAATALRPTVIVLDRCLMTEEYHRLGSEDCRLVAVDDNGEPEILNPSPLRRPESWSPVLASMHEEDASVSGRAGIGTPDSECHYKGEGLGPLQSLRIPIELSWEEIGAITDKFRAGRCTQQHEHVDMFKGFLPDPPGLPVLVKRFSGDFEGVIEAEKRVSKFMFHRNILSPIGYHESSGLSALVFLYQGKGTLDQFLSRVKGKPSGLTCPERMKIATGISCALRYLHEDCRGGPVVHGDLRPCNIFLERGFKAMISGFGRSRWLGKEREEGMTTSSTNSRSPAEEEPLSLESVTLMKDDVFSFGVLLLRLFCRRPLPENDHQLVSWARPLLLQGANHELLDLDMEELDMYEMYRVMSAATQCTKAKPLSRLSMFQVVSILRRETSSVPQSSPSSDSSHQGRDASQVTPNLKPIPLGDG